jgi:RimJ/RimL family protein N-acetyltransferase
VTHPSIPAYLGPVLVRYLEPLDHSLFITLERDAEVRKYINGPSERSDEEFDTGLKSYLPTTSLLAVAHASSNAFLGRCGLLPIRGTNEVELFLLLSRSSQRQGIGARVLTFLVGLAKSMGNEPVGIVHPDNAPSRALLGKVGMVLAGTSYTGYQAGHLRYLPRNAA